MMICEGTESILRDKPGDVLMCYNALILGVVIFPVLFNFKYFATSCDFLF